MATVSSPQSISPSAPSPIRLLKPLALIALLGIAAFFVWHYVFHYYLHYTARGFGDFWPRRGGLLLHITCGTVAILAGPWQFSSRLRQRHRKLHRVTGRVYLIAIAGGSLGAFYLALTTTDGWGFGFALGVLGLAWLTTSGMAFYAILRRQIQIHKEWMVRSYVVTLAFVIFRLLMDYTPYGNLQPREIAAVTNAWACWVIPLLITEVVLQLNRMRVPAKVTTPR